MDTHNIFILTGEFEDGENGHSLRFFGRSESLGTVELIFDNSKPVFFIDHEEKLPSLDFQFERKPLNLKTMRGRAVDGIYFEADGHRRTAEERFKATGVRQYEADVRPVERFLMERFVNGMARIAGEAETNGELTTFKNPKIKGTHAPIPELSLVSLDIETGVTEDKLYSIGVHYKGHGKENKHVFMLADRQREVHDELTFFPTQRALLEAFFAWMKEWDPDLIIGWHVVGFDLMYLERKCRDLSMELDIARGPNGRVVLVDRPGSGAFADISGRVVIDGIPAMRGCGFTFPNYKLETVAQQILQTGKLIASDNNKVAEIERQFREEKEALAKYNLEDCVLVTQIYEKVSLIPLMLERVRTSGLLLDRLGLPTAAFDHFYLPKLHRKGMVAPVVRDDVTPIALPSDAASEPKPGYYEDVAMLAFNNVLPSLIRVFNIDPLARQRADIAPVTMPSGHRFSSTEHLLPELFEGLMQYQGEAAKRQQKVPVKAAAITMKQLCGALSHKLSRFQDAELLMALAAAESWLVKQTKQQLERDGYEVLMADSEHLFVKLAEGSGMGAGEQLAASLNAFWQNKLSQDYGLSSIEVAYACHYTKLLIPPVRRKDGKPLKRYAAMRRDSAGETLVIEGLDGDLNNWTELSQQFLENMLAQYFTDTEGIENWMRDQLELLKEGHFDASLIFRKKIRKAVEEYGQNPPAHIKAARLLDKPGREIRYVFTKQGPYPVDLKPTDYDYDHYINKQLEPVADLILGLMDRQLSKLEEPEQMGLF